MIIEEHLVLFSDINCIALRLSSSCTVPLLPGCSSPRQNLFYCYYYSCIESLEIAFSTNTKMLSSQKWFITKSFGQNFELDSIEDELESFGVRCTSIMDEYTAFLPICITFEKHILDEVSGNFRVLRRSIIVWKVIREIASHNLGFKNVFFV